MIRSLIEQPKGLWVLCALLALTCVAYYPGLSGDYMFDDATNILENKKLILENLDLESLKAASLSSNAGNLKRPVSMASFALNRYFFGINPWSFKVTNLVIHLITGLGLFLLTRVIFDSYRQLRNPAFPELAVRWLPLLITGIWLVHPLNMSSVLYIVQRMTSLAALFTVFGLWLYTLGRLRQQQGRTGFPLILTGLFVCGTLALFSKENGALMPAFAFVIEICLFRFRQLNGKLDKPVLGLFTLILFLPAIAILVALALRPDAFFSSYDWRDFTLLERTLTETRIFFYYLQLIIFPSISELGMYHDDIPLSHGLFDPPTTMAAIIGLVGLFVAALWSLRRHPLLGLGILWFFVAHSIESTILPLELIHEHRNYLAVYGVILGLAYLLTRLPYEKLARPVLTITPVLVISLLAFTTWVRAGQWSDNVSQAVYEARHHPESFRSVYAAGRIHARLALAGQTSSIEQATHYLTIANDLGPSDIMPSIVLMKLYYLLDRPVKQEWLDTVLNRLEHGRVKPAHISALNELVECQFTACKVPGEMMGKMLALLINNDSIKRTTHMKAEAYTLAGYYHINANHAVEYGLSMLQQAIDIEPGEAQHWFNLVNALAELGLYDDAENVLSTLRSNKIPAATEKDLQRLNTNINNRRAENNT